MRRKTVPNDACHIGAHVSSAARRGRPPRHRHSDPSPALTSTAEPHSLRHSTAPTTSSPCLPLDFPDPLASDAAAPPPPMCRLPRSLSRRVLPLGVILPSPCFQAPLAPQNTSPPPASPTAPSRPLCAFALPPRLCSRRTHHHHARTREDAHARGLRRMCPARCRCPCVATSRIRSDVDPAAAQAMPAHAEVARKEARGEGSRQGRRGVRT